MSSWKESSRIVKADEGRAIRESAQNVWVYGTNCGILKLYCKYFYCMGGVHTQELATRGSFRAHKKGMYPETNTLPKQHTPSLQAKLDPQKCRTRGPLPKTLNGVQGRKSPARC